LKTEVCGKFSVWAPFVVARQARRQGGGRLSDANEQTSPAYVPEKVGTNENVISERVI